MNKPRNPKMAFLWLLLIPLQLVIDVLLISLAAYVDVSIADRSALGHPAPAFSIFAMLIAVSFTVVVFVVSIILVIVRYSVLKKKIAATEVSDL